MTVIRKIFVNFILATILVLLTSFNTGFCNDAYNFHLKVTDKETVEQFSKKFPEIANDREVYIAYLMKYYKGNEEAYIELIRY